MKAIREDDFARAKSCAEELISQGAMLTQHPDFKRCFARHFAGCDTGEALAHFCQFLACAGDGRAEAMKRASELLGGTGGAEGAQATQGDGAP